MRRLTAYIMGSISAATFVTAYAFLLRPNFYSATVYLAHSQLSLLILSNFLLVVCGSLLYSLTHFLFGPLRPLETEQLWERGWFAMMEWVFAMSTFRDEFGVWFLIMFLGLFAGKIWGWLCEGRVEVLEQQAGGDNRLVKPRLLGSLAVWVVFALVMLDYCVDVVVVEARPGMTLMFVFEFAILGISAITACARYALWATEQNITRKQVVDAVEARKMEIRKQREEAEEKIKANPTAEGLPRLEELPKEEDVDENEIEAPGWEAKRGWLFGLDILSDLLKLLAYLTFFTILTIFYGIPIYIIRDLYMTLRSFTKRISDYLRFQAATRDMDTRYPNATAQDLAQDNTCIVCREEMRPVETQGEGQAMLQRQKPKKLPCGHILHFGCLSSWLERQQACPICRRSVFPQANGAAAAGGAVPGAVPGLPGAHQAGAPGARPQNPQNQGRVFRFGPITLQLGGQLPVRHNGDQELLNALGRLARQNIQRRENMIAAGAAGPLPAPGANGVAADANATDPAWNDIHPGIRSAAARLALNTLEQQIQRELALLQQQNQRAQYLRNALNELDRARNVPIAPSMVTRPGQQQRMAMTPGGMVPLGFGAPGTMTPSFGAMPNVLHAGQNILPLARAPDGQTNVAPPPGMVLPQGWTLTPLNPIPSTDPAAQPQVLQQFLPTQASSSRMAPPPQPQPHINHPLAQLFFANAMNGTHTPHTHSQPPPHTHVNGPFPPPPAPPANVDSPSGSNGSQQITPTAAERPLTTTTTRDLPTPSPLPPPETAELTNDVPPPPMAVQQSWNFPSMPTAGAPEQAPTSVPATDDAQVANASANKGKALAVDARDIPRTSVEPPTPIDGSVHEGGIVDKQPKIEEAEDEEA